MERLSNGIWFSERETSSVINCYFEIAVNLNSPSDAMDFFAFALGGKILSKNVTSRDEEDPYFEDARKSGVGLGMCAVFYEPTIWYKSIKLCDSRGTIISLSGKWYEDNTGGSLMTLSLDTDKKHLNYYKKKILKIFRDWQRRESGLQNSPKYNPALSDRLYQIEMSIDRGADLSDSDKKLAEQYLNIPADSL